MRLSTLLAFASTSLAFSIPAWIPCPADAFQASEYPIAKAGLLANIGDRGSKDQGAKKGVVIASPSTTDPDYVYTWVRDSSLVYKVIVDTYNAGRDNSLLQGIYDWIDSQKRIQQIPNPSGTVDAGGLGEPKFNINETAFTGSWGRPQRDGPALRSITMITFANNQLKKNKPYVQSIWPAIKLDLDYVTAFWNQSGYDLWEEVYGSSHFTLAASHRSLRQGASLAKTLGYTALAKNYTAQAENILCFLQSFWSSSKSAIISNINGGDYRSGLDANSILTSIHQFDPSAGCDNDTFQPCSEKALSNHKVVVDSFRSIYVVNKNATAGKAAAVGRYSEDVYYGGNPWYLATFAAAEQLYDATYQWLKQGKIEVTTLSLPFFKDIYPSVKVGTYSVVSKDGVAILLAVRQYADGFVAINQKYVGPNGGLAEQFDRVTGAPKSAVDLTWSYASALTAFDRRSLQFPESWGAAGLRAPSGTCKTQPIPKIPVTFNLVSDSDNAFVVGQLGELGIWDPAKAIPLTGTRPNWTVTVQLPISSTFEFKFIRKAADGTVTWESDPNLRYSTPASGSLVINETWRWLFSPEFDGNFVVAHGVRWAGARRRIVQRACGNWAGKKNYANNYVCGTAIGGLTGWDRIHFRAPCHDLARRPRSTTTLPKPQARPSAAIERSQRRSASSTLRCRYSKQPQPPATSFMVSAPSATSTASGINIITTTQPCDSLPSTPSTMTSASTYSAASTPLDNQTPKINGAPSFSPSSAPAKNIWAARDNQTLSAGDARLNEFPALAETRNSPPWAKSNQPSGGNTRASSVNGRDDKPDEGAVLPSGSGKKNKWVPIPAAEMQAALDKARPPRSHSHSRGSSRRNSPGELRRNRRLPDDSTASVTRRKAPTYGSGSVSKPGTANPSPGPMTSLPQPPQPQPAPLLRRKEPRLSPPVSARRPIPLFSTNERRARFGTIDEPEREPEPADLDESELQRRPRQCGRFGVAIGVPLEERNARRAAARRPLSTANDVEDDWVGSGRYNFGILGTFDPRVGLQRAPGPGPGPVTSNYGGMIHSPRPRGGRGRGGMGGGMRGFRGGYRGGGFRSSPADSDYAMLPPMPPMEPYGSAYGFNPYAYGPYGPPPPPMWTPYAPYGAMPMPPPPPPAILGGTAPPPMPVTNLGYMLDPLRYYVLGQVEYYLSVQNMCQDLYLRQQMDSQGWIPVTTVASFNRLMRLTPDVHVVREMMTVSSIVELSADGEKVRMAHGAWAPFVLPDAQDASSTSDATTATVDGTSPATSVGIGAEAQGEGEGALKLVGIGGEEVSGA